MDLGSWMFVSMVGLPVAVVLIGFAFKRRQETLLETTGRHSVGRVLEKGTDSDPLGGGSCWLNVEYNYDGVMVRAKAYVKWRDHQRYQVGQRVGLTYVPGRPQVTALDPPEWALR